MCTTLLYKAFQLHTHNVVFNNNTHNNNKQKASKHKIQQQP